MNTLTSVTATPLIQSFVTYLAPIHQSEQPLAIKLACRLSAQLVDHDQYDRSTHDSTEPTRRQLKAWRRWALNSYYWGSLWRALVTEDDPTDWDVWPQDVRYVLANLNARDTQQWRRQLGTRSVRRFSHRKLQTMLQHLTNYCRYLTWRKLRFISNYDLGIGQDDLLADLLEAGVRTLRRYEQEGDSLKALNFAKRAVHNRAVNLITRHTADKRARLISQPSDEREFLARSVSWEEVGEVVCDHLRAPPLPAVLAISNRFGPAYEHWALAVLGQWPEFDEWVTAWSQDPARLPPQRLHELACQWVGLDPQTVKRNVGDLLQEVTNP